MELPRVDIDKPKYDQSTYLRRVRHFFLVTNPLNFVASDETLDTARQTVKRYRAGKAIILNVCGKLNISTIRPFILERVRNS